MKGGGRMFSSLFEFFGSLLSLLGNGVASW
jgi:hypothetical protein